MVISYLWYIYNVYTYKNYVIFHLLMYLWCYKNNLFICHKLTLVKTINNWVCLLKQNSHKSLGKFLTKLLVHFDHSKFVPKDIKLILLLICSNLFWLTLTNDFVHQTSHVTWFTGVHDEASSMSCRQLVGGQNITFFHDFANKHFQFLVGNFRIFPADMAIWDTISIQP